MSAWQEIRSLFNRRPLQLLILAALLSVVAGRSLLLKFCVLDLDVWWHLKTGDWIFEHGAFPHTGILSRTAANRPWIAYSWGYEVLLSRAYHWAGLVGMGIYGVLLTVMVAYAVFWMCRRLSGSFWWACVIAAAACSAFLWNIMPRPVFFSMTFCSVALTLILEANRTGRVQLLYWLPPMFLLWANLHIQFIYGLFVVGLLLGVNLLLRLTDYFQITPNYVVPATLPIAPLAAIYAACVIASCIGPYGYHLFVVVFQYSQAKLPYTMISELQAINFRAGSHYMQLLLTGAGFFALGWRKRIDLFKLALMIAASIIAYRTMRDSWFICIPAAACMADWSGTEPETAPAESWLEKVGVFAAVAVMLVLLAQNVDFNQRGLDRAISSMFPVNAVNFIRRNPPPGPLYNTFNWGGFLTWYMPDYPVAIDGRTDLYGEDLDRNFFDSQNGQPSYLQDQYLNEAGVVLLEKKAPLAVLLGRDQRFDQIYEDSMAVVFVRHQGAPNFPTMPSPVSLPQ